VTESLGLAVRLPVVMGLIVAMVLIEGVIEVAINP
jgi:hypothetical protein